MIKPLKRSYQPKNLHINVTSMAWKVLGELMTRDLQGDAVCSHYESGAMPGRDWAVHGQEPANFVDYLEYSGISDGFEDYSNVIL